ncbi:MAG: MgtC/SapB family protein [Comamonadaceae bacterium]|nr:MgtC/SapB family protein [Comamonadaceae bacterium]
METSGAIMSAAAVLAGALGSGLLMGIERERRKGRGPQRAFAGVRTFTLAALGGAAAALWGGMALVAVGAALVAALAVAAYVRDRSGDPGVTTEVALWLAYVIGVVCAHSLPMGAALAVVATGLLAARDALHRFARDWLRPAEVRGALVLAALALLVLPLAPHRPLWGEVLDPQVVVRLVLVLLLIQSLAHLGRRLLAARHALVLSALASGFVSSTATIASLGVAVREGREPARRQGGAAVLSCVATMAQILAVAATVQPQWLGRLWAPALAGGLAAALWGWALLRGGGGPAGRAVLEPDAPMFRLRDALLIALLLTGIQVLVHALRLWWGEAGLLAGTLLAALADVHAAVAAVLVQGRPQDAAGPGLQAALAAALSVHALSKCAVAWASGGWRYGLAAGGGVLLHTAAFVAVLSLV